MAIGIWLVLSEQQVATWLTLSRPTVHTHLRAIYRRLNQLEHPHGHVGLALAVERVIAATAHSGAG